MLYKQETSCDQTIYYWALNYLEDEIVQWILISVILSLIIGLTALYFRYSWMYILVLTDANIFQAKPETFDTLNGHIFVRELWMYSCIIVCCTSRCRAELLTSYCIKHKHLELGFLKWHLSNVAYSVYTLQLV